MRWIEYFESDWVGRILLSHYLLGGGESVEIKYNPGWTNYMNEGLKEKVYDELKGIIKNNWGENQITKLIERSLDIKLPNGESITGYNYLHGPHDFRVQAIIKNNQNGSFTCTFKYHWFDVMDPNENYATDTLKSIFAEFITIGYAEKYNIDIFWADEYIVWP